MGYNDPDVYNEPEHFGLTLIRMLDEPGLSWEFNMFGVWRDLDGQLYYATDMGCSCPSPFEDYNGLSDLVPASKAGIMAEARDWGATDGQLADLFDVLDRLPGTWQS
jgi:hypothetical protein